DLIDERDELLGARGVPTGVDHERRTLMGRLDDLRRIRRGAAIGFHRLGSEVDRAARLGASVVRHGIQSTTDVLLGDALHTRTVDSLGESLAHAYLEDPVAR